MLLQLLARKHERESLSLLQELSMRKAEEISALTEKFWNEKGGRMYVNLKPVILPHKPRIAVTL